MRDFEDEIGRLSDQWSSLRWPIKEVDVMLFCYKRMVSVVYWRVK